MKLKKRIAALLMAGAMVCSTLPVNVLAVESSVQNVGGLCQHHTEHNADCGYTEGIEGTPCNHEHTEDCYTLVTSCVHKHTADCYPAESVSDNTASPSDAENQEPVNCTHECSEDTGCIKKELDCKHEHDEACGYVPATEGRPCGYICGECDVEDEPETATPSNAAQLSAGDVQKLIDALPATDKLTTMTKDERNAVYADLQAAYEAYQALTEDEQALLTGTEVFESLFHFFNGMVNLLATANGVSYLDENGDEQTADNVTVVESSMTTWNGGWYVVNNIVTIGSRVTVSGEVHLILADGASLTVNDGINVAEGNSFSVYAQSDSENMGALTATGVDFAAGIGGGSHGSGGNITISGGNVTASGGDGAAGIGNGKDSGSGGNIIIHGGSVKATGGQYAAGIGGGLMGSGGTITIHGGSVTANGGDEAAGIGGGVFGSGGKITINGGNVTATSGNEAAGIGGGAHGSGGNITINGGTVTATSVTPLGAGIGGGQESSGGNITINGGTVTATGGPEGAGIGSGSHGSYDTITINGGSVTATGGELAAGIGGGIGDEIGGYGGSFTTGTDGHALIVASSISDKSQRDSWSGIIFEGDTGEVYGNPTIQENVEIPSGKTLTVPENTTLTVSSGVTLTNSGTITNSGIITNSGTITNNGTITGNGTLGGEGNLVGSGTVAPTITNNLQKDSAVSVTVSPSPATYGSKVNITATISRAATISKAANAITRAAENQVEFFVGTDSNKKSLGTANVSGDIATLSDVEISQEKGFAVGENTITAEYGGSMGLKPQTGSTRLTVQRDLKDAIVTVNGEYFYTNSPIIPEVSVTWNGTQLTKDTDYTVDYTDNTNAGKATVTVSGKGNYTGTKTEKFTIAPASYQITLAGRADSPTKITLDKAVVNPSDTGATITYGYSTTDATPTNWQMEREFTGLKAGTTYYFFAKATATANYAETISKGVAITTPEKTVSAIKISKQPNKLSYTSGQKLNLSGLSVQVNYKDNTNKTILWESGKLTAEPAQETVLTVANHNGKTITISYGGQTAQTDVLTVGKAEQATLSITGAPGKIYKGSSFTLQTSGGSGKGAVTWSVVSGSAKVDAKGSL